MIKATLKVVSMNIATKECKSTKTFSREVPILDDIETTPYTSKGSTT